MHLVKLCQRRPMISSMTMMSTTMVKNGRNLRRLTSSLPRSLLVRKTMIVRNEQKLLLARLLAKSS